MLRVAPEAARSSPAMSGTPVPDPREAVLLDRCLRGEAAAWEEFVRTYHAGIEGAVRLTFLRCLSAVPQADVENVVQELYARLYEDGFRRLRSYAGRCPFTLWLRSLAVRLALNTLRAETLRGRFGGAGFDDRPLAAEGRDETARAAEREEASRLEALIEHLGPLHRTALRMFYYDGLSYREIARALGIGVGTVGSLITRARDRLRSNLGAEE
jgi:RNA polymerase sigma-70 factor (ECF subfamily)